MPFSIETLSKNSEDIRIEITFWVEQVVLKKLNIWKVELKHLVLVKSSKIYFIYQRNKILKLFEKSERICSWIELTSSSVNVLSMAL